MRLGAGWLITIAAIFVLLLPARGQERLGIVLLHGRGAMPQQFLSYDAPLAKQGYLVERPEMCWSRQRIYDRPYLECLRDVDEAIEWLRTHGMTGFVVAGQSLGANAALAYGARHDGLKGVIALAPAHLAELLPRRAEIASSIKRAQELIAAGHGESRFNFADVSGGRISTVTTTPKIYLSFFGEISSAVMPVNAARLKAPLLLVAGNQDPSQRGPSYIFDKAPPNPLNRYVTVKSDHVGTPRAAREVVLKWLGELSAH
jgi:pimeloyl-ACP methyl ester carboxylesterase